MGLYFKQNDTWTEIAGGPAAPAYNAATGGVETTYTKDDKWYKVHTFTGNANLNVTKASNPFHVLLVGGASGSSGGSGGGTGQPDTAAGRGGNSGEVWESASFSLSVDTHAVVCGVGSAGGALNGDSVAGGVSSIAGQTAAGGAAVTGNGPNKYEVGGAGASGPQSGGTGGPGVASTITGESVIYGAGGGGGNGNYGGTGEAPGGSNNTGGKGGSWSVAPTSGVTPGSGPGGGIGGGRKGQDGIVVVSYEIEAPAYNEASGGEETTYTKDGKWFKVHTFTSSGTLVVSKAPNPSRVLVVAGGGGGDAGGEGSYGSGGGGGRTPYVNDAVTLPVSALPVTVGNGGTAGGYNTSNGGAGGASSFNGVTVSGGSGTRAGSLGGASSGGTPTASGGAGSTANGSSIHGGAGTKSDISGTLVGYCGGGAGTGGASVGVAVDGGGSGSGSGPAPAAPANRGGGGGGTYNQHAAAAGADGVVIVSYEIVPPPYNEASGGEETTYTKDGKWFKVHSFTENEDFIVTKVGSTPFRVLAIAGGGGGASHTTSGSVGAGGAGGVLDDVEVVGVALGSHPVIVGGGGAGNGYQGRGGNGGNSSVLGVEAIGGGGGASEWARSGADGGSGGGSQNHDGGSGSPGTGIPPQGTNGSTDGSSGGYEFNPVITTGTPMNVARGTRFMGSSSAPSTWGDGGQGNVSNGGTGGAGYQGFVAVAYEIEAPVYNSVTGGTIVEYEASRSNLCSNGGFDTNIDGWIQGQSANTLSHSTSEHMHGSGSLKTEPAETNSSVNNTPQLTEGKTYTISLYAKAATVDSAKTDLIVQPQNGAGASVGAAFTMSKALSVAEGWQRWNVTFTQPAGATQARVRMVLGAVGVFYVDSCLIEESGTLGEWFDADFSAWYRTHTVTASGDIVVNSGDMPFTVLRQGGGGAGGGSDNNRHGGGGYGGVGTVTTDEMIPAGTYPVVIGRGGNRPDWGYSGNRAEGGYPTSFAGAEVAGGIGGLSISDDMGVKQGPNSDIADGTNTVGYGNAGSTPNAGGNPDVWPAANSGGGGNGGRNAGPQVQGAPGGSGVVIIRYEIEPPALAVLHGVNRITYEGN